MNRSFEGRIASASAMILGLAAGAGGARAAPGDVVFATAELYPVGSVPVGVTIAGTPNGSVRCCARKGGGSVR